MRIAVVANKEKQNVVFSKKGIEMLESLGEVVWNDGESDPEGVKKFIKDADIAVTSWLTAPLTAEILDECPNLKLVVHAAGSVKPIVTDALWARGIRVCASTRPLGIGVAETALGFAISASKNFYQLNNDIHNGGYSEHYSNVKELYELNVGVVSAGFVGRHFIKLMNNFGVNILVYDPFLTEEGAAALGCKKVEFTELLKESDILSIHAPSIPETNKMFNRETLALMKKDAVLINTARGSIVDEEALYEHMKAGNLKYACLDVYDPEPILPENPLRTLPNVIMTPHIAGLATNGKLRIGVHAAEEIERFLKGEKMLCEVTEDMLATIA